MRLIDINDEINALIDELTGEDLTEEQLQERASSLCDLSDMKCAKVDAICFARDELQARADAQAAIAKKMDDLSESTERQITRIDNYLKYVMQAGNVDHLKGDTREVIFAKGPQPELEWTAGREPTPEELADTVAGATFVRQDTKKTLDKKGIRDALKAGQELPFVRFGKTPRFVRVK